MAEYTRGKWAVASAGFDRNFRKFVIMDDEFHNLIAEAKGDTREEAEANANLICIAVNQCQKINQENPQAVAEAIRDMYHALKDMPIPEPITVDGKFYQAVPYELMANWWMKVRKPLLTKVEDK